MFCGCFWHLPKLRAFVWIELLSFTLQPGDSFFFPFYFFLAVCWALPSHSWSQAVCRHGGFTRPALWTGLSYSWPKQSNWWWGLTLKKLWIFPCHHTPVMQLCHNSPFWNKKFYPTQTCFYPSFFEQKGNLFPKQTNGMWNHLFSPSLYLSPPLLQLWSRRREPFSRTGMPSTHNCKQLRRRFLCSSAKNKGRWMMLISTLHSVSIRFCGCCSSFCSTAFLLQLLRPKIASQYINVENSIQ